MATTDSTSAVPTGVTLTDPRAVSTVVLRRRRVGRRTLGRHDSSRRSGHGRHHRHRPSSRWYRNARGHRRRGARLSRVAQENREGTRRGSAALVRVDDRQSGRSGSPDDERAGQAAHGGTRRGDLRGGVSGMVRRGSQARLRRHDSRPSARQAHRRPQTAGRRRGVHHALEFSARDDHAEGRAGARGRLHRRPETRVADAVLGAGARRACRARGRSQGRVQRRDRICRRHRRPS